MTSTTLKRTIAPEAAPKAGFRPDIQGLRALAVVAVILNHGLDWPHGGFVGVDVFFVISGFLITGLLLREHDRTGTISFPGFYRRRVRRILPAAILALTVTVFGSWLIFSAAQAGKITLDAIAALLFSANWRFALLGTDYFNASGPVSPLQHFWSLAVEEQFYFVWPWLMLLIFVIAKLLRRRRTQAHGAIAFAIVVLTISSFSWAIMESAANPTFAYFSTFSRAWELGVGAILAVASPLTARIPNAIRQVLGWVGLLTIIDSLFVVTSVGFPAPWGALPVFGAAAVIVSGTNAPRPFLFPLVNPVATYIGEISYSLYLWHFPAIILLGALFPSTIWSQLTILAVMLGVSIVSFHYVEEPIRRSGDRRLKKFRGYQDRRIGIPALVALVLVTSGLITANVAKADLLESQNASIAAVSPNEADPSTSVAVISKVDSANAAALSAALTAESWPTLKPSIDTMKPVSAWVKDNCLNISESNLNRCVYGDKTGKNVLALLGDSTAISYLPAIEEALPAGWKIQVLTLEACPVIDVPVTKVGGAAYPSCTKHRTWALAWVKTHRPALVVATDTSDSALRIPGATGGAVEIAAIARGAQSAFRSLSQSAEHVLVLPPPPDATTQLTACKTNVSTPAQCVNTVPRLYTSYVATERSVADSLAAANLVVYPTDTWFCISTRCPSFVDRTPELVDTSHLSDDSSRRLGPLMKEAVAAGLKTH